MGRWFDQITNGAVHGCCLPQLLRRRAEISSCLRMVERPRMFCARAFFISCSLVWSARDAERDPLLRVAAACLAESLRSADLACDDFFWPEPPLRLPPPDCLLTVAQARASAPPARRRRWPASRPAARRR